MIEPYISDVCYDLETYPNVFTAVFEHVASGAEVYFEISDRVNQSTELYTFLATLKRDRMRLVGYNNVGFDYPVLHDFVTIYSAQGVVYSHQLHQTANRIIHSENRWANIIWPDQRFLPQLDLYLIHHFDNMAKSTSLKALEVNMRSHTVQDLPFDPTKPVPLEDIPALLSYNRHDVKETVKFYRYSLSAISTREDLTRRFNTDFTNHNDTKIGKEFFIMELEKRHPGVCFDRSSGRKQPRQTPRPEGIPLGDIIFPYVKFEHPEFQRVLDYLRTVTITNTKSSPELKDLHAIVGGFRFDFGTGGIHGSIDKRVVTSDEEFIIVDADITSMYPNIAIRNKVYPQHLGEMFCDVYEDLYNTRQQYPKKSAENLLYKLALNGVYGDSNNDYGPFKDPQYTMTITVNGQLSVCMCAERVIAECDAEPIQVNTDGFTVRIPRDKRQRYDEICKEWESVTKLQWEFAEYSSMFVRDVNNYIGLYTDGRVKRVGAYQHLIPIDDAWSKQPERGWHQDHSALIVPKAAEAVMLRGENLEQFIKSHTDPFDFMLRVKVPRSSRLVMAEHDFPTAITKDGCVTGYRGEMPRFEQVQNICRYFIARDGSKLVKIMPPTKAPRHRALAAGQEDHNPLDERYIGVEASHTVALCNVTTDFDWSRLDYSYYVEEARKLLLTPGDLFARTV
jgi:hypothetical protein